MHLTISIFLISLCILSLEITLMRTLSITQWHHFAYMIVSLALLGFGASGSFLSLFWKKLSKFFEPAQFLFILLFGLSIPASFAVSQTIDFNAFQALWFKAEYLKLLLFCLTLFFPFFFGALFIGSVFAREAANISSLYAANLAGSAAGCVCVIIMMYHFSPVHILIILSVLALLSALIFARGKTIETILGILVLVASVAYFLLASPPAMNISEYKHLRYLNLLPDAKHVKRTFSPLGMIDLVRSSAIREAPGLSLAFGGAMPAQAAIVIDADSVSPVIKNPDAEHSEYLDYMTFALPYYLKDSPSVLVVGAGGASVVSLALNNHAAREVTALELDPAIISIAREEMGPNDVYSRPQVTVQIKEARNHLEATPRQYDIIDVSLINSFGASSAGVYALSESYLYTRQAICVMLRRLAPDGLLAISRWEEALPRENLKLFATALEALEEAGTRNPAEHLLMIRSQRTVTLLVKKNRLTESEIETAKNFCDERFFDIAFYPGMTESNANRFIILEEPFYFNGCKELLSQERQDFYDRSPFYIRPATDNKPYFFHTFRWKCIPVLKKYFGQNWLAYAEIGYIILIGVLVTSIGLSILLIIIPLLFLRHSGATPCEASRPATVLYFSSIGIAFMFIEMSFFQQFILLLGHPIFSISVILAAFLAFSGLGSFCSKKVIADEKKRILFAVICIAAISAIYLIFLPKVLGLFISENDLTKIAVSVTLIAPLAFFMGFPFPSAMAILNKNARQLVPWAWGINGCASVVSAPLATLLAISFGFRVVILAAVLLYLVASAAALKLRIITFRV